jgi:hypothetical protein
MAGAEIAANERGVRGEDSGDLKRPLARDNETDGRVPLVKVRNELPPRLRLDQSAQQQRGLIAEQQRIVHFGVARIAPVGHQVVAPLVQLVHARRQVDQKHTRIAFD